MNKKNCNSNIEYFLNIKCWPLAVNKSLLCDTNNEEMKLKRAEGIVNFLKSENIYDESKKVLDYGCGEGHLAKELNCIGYDIKKYNWIEENNLTCDFEKVKSSGLYDLIILYDVVDHMEELESINKLKDVLNEGGKIFVRCHPWSGRHGGHLYHKDNRAFIHLFLEEGCNNPVKVKDPENFYQLLFENFGYKVEKSFVHSCTVESFFSNKCLEDKLKIILNENDLGRLKLKMSIVFYDFILKV